MRTASPFAALAAPLVLSGLALAQGASFTTFGTGCPASGRHCPSNNSGATTLQTAVRPDVPQIALQVSAITPVVQGFEILTKSPAKQSLNAWIFLPDASGKPQATPVATGQLAVDTQLGWYRATFTPPVTLGNAPVYFLSWDAGTPTSRNTTDPIVPLGLNSTHFERKSANDPWTGAYNRSPWAWRVICAGGSSMVPEIVNLTDPALGNKLFEIRLRNAPASAPCVLIFGVSDKTWGALNLPFDLSPFGAPKCSLLVSVDLLFGNATDAAGDASHPLPVPNNGALKGVTFFGQWMIVDFGANALGLVFSNGAKVVLGDAE